MHRWHSQSFMWGTNSIMFLLVLHTLLLYVPGAIPVVVLGSLTFDSESPEPEAPIMPVGLLMVIRSSMLRRRRRDVSLGFFLVHPRRAQSRSQGDLLRFGSLRFGRSQRTKNRPNAGVGKSKGTIFVMLVLKISMLVLKKSWIRSVCTYTPVHCLRERAWWWN